MAAKQPDLINHRLAKNYALVNGIHRVSKDVCKEVNTFLKEFHEELVRRAKVIMEYNRRSTLKGSDVSRALEQLRTYDSGSHMLRDSTLA